MNQNQLNPMETARYILEHPESDPEWLAHVTGLVDWVERTFGKPLIAGARPIAEQSVFPNEMGSHTARYASINALLYEATGNQNAREKAYRAFNWATYMADARGVVIDGPGVNQVWFTDGYGDYIRHFMAGIGAVPEWAPSGQNRLIRSSSVVTSVTYAPTDIGYTTFDADATEVLRIGSAPDRVTADGAVLAQRGDLGATGWTYDAAGGVLRIRHTNATHIRVEGGGAWVMPSATPPAGAGGPPSLPSGPVLTFDDRPGQNQALDGQYPTGVIDWGTGDWWQSAPWGRFTTKSISFNGSGRTSATFTFVTPRRLVRLDAYNGGSGSSTVTLACAGQPTKTQDVAASEMLTIDTSWTGTCAMVTVTSTNGWDTNFDNLTIDGG
jgi:hypothetical protein